jgi:outer membrane lipoprotein-sorting protein
MRKFCAPMLGGSLLLMFAAFAVAGDDDGRAIVNKSIEASGGEKALATHNSVTFKEKGTFHGMGMAQPYAGTYHIQYPGQFRMEIEGVFTVVLDGDKGWINAAGEIKEMDKKQLASQQNDYKAGYMASLLPLKDKAFTLKKLADAKVDKMDAQVVEASRKDWPTIKLFFDKKTNYLVKMEYKSKAADMDFKEVTMANVLSDFRKVDGAMVPHKMNMTRDGEKFVEGEVIEMKTGKLDAKTFAMPK